MNGQGTGGNCERLLSLPFFIGPYSLPRPPLWSSGQSSWLQIQRPRLDSRRYQIIWVAVGLERGPLSLVSTTEELPGRKSSGSGLEIREYGRRDPSRWPRGTLYPQKVGTNRGRSVGLRPRSLVYSLPQFHAFVLLSLYLAMSHLRALPFAQKLTDG
jgi:hypothetical protein